MTSIMSRESIVDAEFSSRETLRSMIVFPEVLNHQFWQDLAKGFMGPKYLGLREMMFY